MSKETAMAVATGSTVVSDPSGGAVGGNAGVAPPQTPELKSNAFSHLAKKEAELVRLRQEINADKEKVTPILKKAEEFEALRKTDPVAAMKMLGFTETEIFNYMAQQQPEELSPEQKAVKAAEDAANAKIKAFEDSQEKKEQERQAQADEALIKTYRNNISSAIKADPDKYEYCTHYGPVAEELIYETVLSVVEKSEGKEVPTPEEAAQMVEEYYEEQDKAMSNLKKRQPKVEAPVPEQAPTRTRTPSPQQESPAKPPRTLSNSATATVASTKIYNESREQKRERLMQKLRG